MITRLGNLWTTSLPAYVCALLAVLMLVAVAVRLSIIDVRTHRLPNGIVLPTFVAAAVLLPVSAVAAAQPMVGLRTFLGAVVLGALYLFLRILNPAGMGQGDVKLSAVLGLYLGYLSWTHLLLGALSAFVLGGLWGVALIATRRGTAQTHIPFGPFMLSGALAVMLLPA